MSQLKKGDEWLVSALQTHTKPDTIEFALLELNYLSYK